MAPIHSVLDAKDVSKILIKKTSNFHENFTWNLIKISSDGFMGSYYRLEIQNSTEIQENFSFFVKTLPPEGPQRDFVTQNGAFSKEILVYNEIIPEIGQGAHRWAPECYFCTDQVIVLENLEEFSNLPKGDFDFMTLKSLFSCFARMHTRSLIWEQKTGKKIIENWPEMTESLFQKTERSMRYQNSSLRGFSVLIDLVLPKELRKKTKDKVLKWWEGILKALEPWEEFRNVICHRDVWAANFMFKEEENQLDCRLLDFQYCSYTIPAMDLVVALYLNTNREIRDRYFEELMKWYHQEVQKCLKEENLEGVWTWEEFWKSCKVARPWGMMYNVFGQQMTLLDDEVRRTFDDPIVMEEMIYGDKRPELVGIQFERNLVFREKFTELIWEIFENLPDNVV